MAALELISGYVTAPDTTETAITSNNSTSKTIRNFQLGRAFLVAAWANGQAVGYVKIFSPRMHDNSNGFQFQLADASNSLCWPIGQPQEVYAQDTLTIKKTGSATAGDIENVGALVYYEQYTEGRFITLKELNNRRLQVLALRNSFTALVAGEFHAGTALSAVTSGDILIANTDYAVLGASFSQSDTTNLGAHALTIQGPDTGNLPVGLPLIEKISQDFFVRMSKAYDAAMIPVFNSANKGGTLLKVNNDENANTIIVTLFLAQLR